VERQRAEGWGKSIVERLAADLKDAFPDMKGFSPNNIWRMRSFYLAWNLEAEILAQAVQELGNLPALSPPAPSLPSEVADLLRVPSSREILAQLVQELPWGHNLVLVQRIKASGLRAWYAQNALLHGWSRNILEMQIETGLHQRQGKAPRNFPATLPPPESDLAGQILNDPYNFDFLGLGDEAHEREVGRALLARVRRFLLEMGEGFALVGQQYRLTVGDEDHYIDLLFYHIRLRCYVVVELKAAKFKPAFVGQLNFYLSAIDDRLRREGDNPTIGLILCKSTDKLAAEYALRGLTQPLAVADYLLTKAIPQELQGALPTIEEIEAELATVEGLKSPEAE
jgi:predicted nuclease of restriction endonuclease-like (RecB) superfamily